MEKRVEAEEVAAQEMSITVDSVSDDRKYSSPPRAHFSSLTKLAHHRLLNFPKPTVSLAKKAGAEFVGTFVIIFAAAAASIVNKKYGGVETLIGGAGASGLAVMVMVVATGHISGAHLNPAVTLSFATFGHLPWAQVPAYFGAQVTASISAGFLLKGVYHPFLHGGVTVPSVAYWQAFLLELLISFNLMFVITAVATDNRAPRQMAGIAVGTTVMVNILIAGPGSGGSMNPVRTLGPAIAARNFKGIWIYMIAPPIGTIVGAAAYTAVRLYNDDNQVDLRRR
ncbi:probable aquaporin NIP5-1 isoform X2 [Nymphaea colorata]|uniref:probable aquaporin NIP5-1 isoform X2 n=1 Tax=Nymphaea colorata TaxID=210225 RepID=UPI00129DA37D|nr:probable aquaporin NIP5-1 isoform X2 [Nymphaea colorata]